MQHFKRAALIFTFAASTVFTACGSGDPDIDQIRDDFASPSGSVQDSDAVVAANSKMGATEAGLAGAASVNPFGGFGLTARLGDASIAKLPTQSFSARRVARLPYEALLRQLPVSAQIRALGAEDGFGSDPLDSCFSQEDFIGSQSISGSSAHASFDTSADLSGCTSNMSGTVSIEGEMDVALDGSSLEAVFKMRYEQVCETTTNACIDGVVVFEMNGEGEDSFTTAEIIQGWDLTLSWDEEGAAKSMQTKGGLRIAGESTGFGQIEYLLYVRDSKGEEVSYVLSLSGGNGVGELSIKGRDGELSCSFNGDGSGACSGSYSFDWTPEDTKRIESDDKFTLYDGN